MHHARPRRCDRVIVCELLTVDTVLLRRIYVLIFVEHGTRRLQVAGVTAHPTGAWLTQQVRNLAMDVGEHLDSGQFLIRGRGRDRELTAAFEIACLPDGGHQSAGSWKWLSASARDHSTCASSNRPATWP
jgi:putative transposase